MIMRTKLDVVLLDIVMPGMDGISVMEKVKSNEEFKENTSFIMVTAASSENLTADAFKLGARLLHHEAVYEETAYSTN